MTVFDRYKYATASFDIGEHQKERWSLAPLNLESVLIFVLSLNLTRK